MKTPLLDSLLSFAEELDENLAAWVLARISQWMVAWLCASSTAQFCQAPWHLLCPGMAVHSLGSGQQFQWLFWGSEAIKVGACFSLSWGSWIFGLFKSLCSCWLCSKGYHSSDIPGCHCPLATLQRKVPRLLAPQSVGSQGLSFTEPDQASLVWLSDSKSPTSQPFESFSLSHSWARTLKTVSSSWWDPSLTCLLFSFSLLQFHLQLPNHSIGNLRSDPASDTVRPRESSKPREDGFVVVRSEGALLG